MSLPKKDLRVYFKHDVHAALRVLAEIERLEMSELVERVMLEWVARQARRASLIASQIDVERFSKVDAGLASEELGDA